MASNGMSWKDDIIQQLRKRNKDQTSSFSSLILANNKLWELSTALKNKNTQLQTDHERLKAENFQLSIKADSGGQGGGDRAHALEQKLYRAQEELTELHKKKGENVQQIIDLKNAVQDKEKELSAKEAKILDQENNLLAMKGAEKSLQNTIVELEATNQMLKDEHQALQLAFTALEDKYQKAQDDNQELVARWMAQKARDADVMNEENAVFLRKRQEKLRKELADAATEPVNLSERERVMLPGCLTPVCTMASVPSRALCKFDAHDGEVNAIQWSPSGRLFATGGADRKIKLWESTTGQCNNRGVLLGSNAGIMSLEFDDEETLVLAASNDFASRVWSLGDQRLRHTLTGHSGKVLAAKFLSDTSKVVSGSHDRTLKVWDLHSRACVKTIFAGSSCNDLVTLHGNHIVSGHFDKRVRFWDTRSDTSTNEIMLQGRLTSLSLAPDRSQLLCCTRDDSMKIIDLRMNQVSTTLVADNFKVGSDWSRAVFSPDGTYALAGSSDGTLFIWNIGKNKVEKTLKEHSHAILACSWNPNGASIVSCEKSKKCILWSDF